MTRTAIYTPSIWGAAALIVFTAMMGLADGLLVAWWIGSAWGLGVAAGAIVGLMLSVAWALRRYLLAVSIGLLVTSAAMTIVLARSSPSAGLSSVFVALGIWGFWFLSYDLWFTGRANTEFVSPVTTLGGDGSAGRALIVHHRGRGPAQFQARVQRAFAEGLQAHGWQVDITTASRQTSTDLSGYDLLVLGAQAYNWSPARPIVDYVDRVGNLRGKPVVVIVSGGGMTERAIRVLQTCIVQAEGVIVDAIEIWTSRPNEDRHGLTDPVAIMRRAGARVTLVPQRKTA
jgi:hypothetical protein